MTRYIALAFALAIAYTLTHRPAVGCALIGMGAGMLPPIEPPLDMRERIEDRMLDTYCRSCPAMRHGERWLP